MQHYSLCTHRSIIAECCREDDDVFSSLIDKVFVDSSEDALVDAEQWEHAFIGFANNDDLEPTPLREHHDDTTTTRIPMIFDHSCQSSNVEHVQEVVVQTPREGNCLVRQVSQTSFSSSPHSAFTLQHNIMMQLGQSQCGGFLPSFVCEQDVDQHIKYPVGDDTTTRIRSPCPLVVSSSSSPIPKQRTPIADIALPTKQVVSTTTKRRNKHSEDRMLPEAFVPGPYTVIIGRRTRTRQATGNQRLRKIAMSFLNEYAKASDKQSKSRIVTTIWRILEDACPEGGGAFVRLGAEDRWYKVRDCVATEKVGYRMRELLGERYRSSSMGKKMAKLAYQQ